MKKILTVLLILFTGVIFVQAQEEKAPEYGWKKQVVGDLNFTQNAFDNWTQGGENSWTWALLLNATLELDKEHFNWSNSGKLEYGKTKVGDASARKAADEIKLESVYTYKLTHLLNPYAAVRAETQFDDGFNYDVTPRVQTSEAFDPLYVTESFGAGYKPSDRFKTRLGVAFKQTISDYGYADDPDTKDEIEDFRSEVGAESVSELNMPLSERILYNSKLELFSDISAIKNVDVNWDNTFSAKVSELIKVSFNFRLFYDSDISSKRQIKQTLAVGLSYTFL